MFRIASVVLVRPPVAGAGAVLFDLFAAAGARTALVRAFPVTRRGPSAASKLGVAVAVVGSLAEYIYISIIIVTTL